MKTKIPYILFSYRSDLDKTLGDKGDPVSRDIANTVLKDRRLELHLCDASNIKNTLKSIDQRAIFHRTAVDGNDMFYGLIEEDILHRYSNLATPRINNRYVYKNKIQMLLKLKRNKIPINPFEIIPVHNFETFYYLIKKTIPLPLIVKLFHGTEGKTVFPVFALDKIKLKKLYQSIKDNIRSNPQAPLVAVEKYMENSWYNRVRAIVIGGKLVGAVEFKRKSNPAKVKDASPRGREIINCPLPEKARLIVEKSARILGYEMAGIDLYKEKLNQWKIIEVNGIFVTTASSQVLGLNINQMIVDFMVQKFIKKNFPS